MSTVEEQSGQDSRICAFIELTENKLTSFSSALPTNLNLYWLSITGIFLWFFFVHTPPFLLTNDKWKDVLLWFHLVGVGGIYVACIVNSLITPSINRRLHVTVGRIGFVLGAWGFGWGAWMSWGRKPVDLDFAIPITIGGVLQIISQALGYWAIQQYRAVGIKIAEASSPEREAQLKGEQQSHLMLHIGCMIGLFVNACTIPAIIRVTDGGGVPLLLAAIGGLNILSHFYSNHFFTRMRNAVITSRADEMTPLVN